MARGHPPSYRTAMATDRFVFPVRVRMADVDADRRFAPHRLLECLLEAASGESELQGYGRARYDEMQATWLIREINFAVDGAVEAGDELQLETWIRDLRRFRSRRAYRGRHNDQVVLRAETDWFFVSTSGDKFAPRHPDEEMKAAFPIQPERALSDDEIPGWPQAEEPRVVHTLTVVPSEIDLHGHVSHLRYAAWLDDAGRLDGGKQPICFARLLFENEARLHDTLQVRAFDSAPGYFEIHRGEQRLMRAFVRREALG